MLASDAIHPFLEKVDWAAWARRRLATKYYNPDMHYASFVLSTQLQTVLHGVPRLAQLAPSIFPRYDVSGVVQWPVGGGGKVAGGLGGAGDADGEKQKAEAARTALKRMSDCRSAVNCD